MSLDFLEAPQQSQAQPQSSDLVSTVDDADVRLLFMQALFGCADTFSDHPVCVQLRVEMVRSAEANTPTISCSRVWQSLRSMHCAVEIQPGGIHRGKHFSQNWVALVNAILAGQIDDAMCKMLLQGASAVLVPNTDSFDFLLQRQVVQPLLPRPAREKREPDAEKVYDAIVERYGAAWGKLRNDEWQEALSTLAHTHTASWKDAHARLADWEKMWAALQQAKSGNTQ